MPRRRVGQLGFMDAAVSGRPNGGVDALAEVDRLVDWAAFERLLDPIHCAPRGEASYDRGYDGDPLRARLSARGLGDGVMRRRRGAGAGPGAPLAPEAVARNHRLSLVRRAVESVFGTLKRSYRMARMRGFTMRRNAVDLTLFANAFNLRRWRALATP